MELTSLPAIIAILFAAIGGRLLSQKINQPEVLGELIFGMIIGQFIVLSPSAKEPVSLLADIGIFILLFSIGLDLNLERFEKLLFPAGMVAAGGVILPFLFGYFIAISFGFSQTVAFFLATSLVATSVGVSGSILQEAGKLNTRVGTLIMDSAILDDVVAVTMVTITLSFARTHMMPLKDVFFIILFSVIFFVVSLTLGVRALKGFSERIQISDENLILGTLLMLISFALIAEKIGLAGIIGGFVAGLIIGQTRFSQILASPISSIGNGFFIPIFFVTVGMKFDLGGFTPIGLFAIIFIILAVAGKIIGSGLGAKLFDFNNQESFVTGVAMVPRAGVELVLVNSGLEHNLIGQDIASAILVMVIVSTLITPPLLWQALRSSEEIR